MKARLQGGHFRMLNEKLYTCRGEEALQLFSNSRDAFNLYHAGYKQQLVTWPTLPLDLIIRWLQERSPSLRVADFGCGDARLAASVPNKVYSFDLQAVNEHVISCNMAHTPLASTSVDVAIFCLSLMGTDYPSYLEEARRVLASRGWLLIAEVRSRFDLANGGASIDDFVKCLCSLGFKLESQDVSNKMFLLLYLQKCARSGEGKRSKGELQWPPLKACMYKKR
eukprot:SM000277S10339  [mRNA]  locus=s277:25737:28080:+ [translate_table: standard]